MCLCYNMNQENSVYIDGRMDMEKKKNIEINVNGKEYQRLPIKTHVVMYGEILEDVVKKYATEHIQENDILFVSEKIVAITQGRAYLVKDIKPRKLAYMLSNKVTKTKAGKLLVSPSALVLTISTDLI